MPQGFYLQCDATRILFACKDNLGQNVKIR